MENKNALQIIETARSKGALAFVGQGISETVPLYKLEPTEIEVKRENFHDLDGKLVLKKEFCDRIADAAGISFITASVESIRAEEESALGLPARTIFVGHAQGKTRLPDGSWRESAPETYEFDYVAKAKSEAGTDVGKERRKAQEYYKAGPMRAATGARLRVIRQLTGMPTAFSGQEIGAAKVFVFSRIVQNTDYILSTPEGKTMAIAMETGAAQMLYGKRQEVPQAGREPTQEEPPMRNATPGAEEKGPANDDWGQPARASAPPSELETLIQALTEWAVAGGSEGARAQRIIDRGESDLRILRASLAIIKYLATNNQVGRKSSLEALDMLVPDVVILEDIVSKIKGVAA